MDRQFARLSRGTDNMEMIALPSRPSRLRSERLELVIGNPTPGQYTGIC